MIVDSPSTVIQTAVRFHLPPPGADGTGTGESSLVAELKATAELTDAQRAEREMEEIKVAMAHAKRHAELELTMPPTAVLTQIRSEGSVSNVRFSDYSVEPLPLG